jgi:hypothetical protein
MSSCEQILGWIGDAMCRSIAEVIRSVHKKFPWSLGQSPLSATASELLTGLSIDLNQTRFYRPDSRFWDTSFGGHGRNGMIERWKPSAEIQHREARMKLFGTSTFPEHDVSK